MRNIKGFSAVSEKEMLDVNGGYDSPVDMSVDNGAGYPPKKWPSGGSKTTHHNK